MISPLSRSFAGKLTRADPAASEAAEVVVTSIRRVLAVRPPTSGPAMAE